jgi:hypothetical protein
MSRTKRQVEDITEGVKNPQDVPVEQRKGVLVFTETYTELMRYLGTRPIDEAGALYSSLSSLPQVDITITPNGAA